MLEPSLCLQASYFNHATMNNMRKTSTVFTLLLLCFSAFGQLSTEEVKARLYEQLLKFPQEKIHLHIDKEAYVSGETIWFRAYLVNALLHIEDLALSRYLYVELVNPEGQVVYHYQIRPDEYGFYHNNVVLAEDLPEGTYRLRSYTRYTSLSRPEYIYEHPLFIANPLRDQVSVEASFRQRGNNNFAVKFTFHGRTDSEPVNLNNFKFRVGNRFLTEYPAQREIQFRLPDENQHVYIEFEHNNRLYRKYIPVLVSDSEFDLAFFPEGGYLVAGSTNSVGFKAINSHGFSETVTGEIYEEDGGKIAEFNTLHAGMGSVTFYAQANKRYYALSRNESGTEHRFELPVPDASVYALQVKTVGKSLLVGYNRGAQAHKTPLTMLIHMKGVVVHHAKIEPDRGVRIDLATLPSGLLQILLLDDNMNTISERLFFCSNGLATKTQITTDKQKYGRRELVKVKVKTEDLERIGIEGSLSVSVTDDKDILPDTTRSIVSNLLLTSELRGNIEEPEYYFSGKDSARKALDALMMTQGWRRYDIPKTLIEGIEEPTGYVELKQEIAGKVTRLITGSPLENSPIILLSPDNEYFSETLSDSNGRFYFNGFEFPDSTRYVLQALSVRGRSSVEIKPDKYDTLYAKAEIFKERSQDGQFLNYVAKSDKFYSQKFGPRTIELDPVVVSARRSYSDRSIYSSEFNASLNLNDFENFYDNIPLLVRMIPGLIVTDDNKVLIQKGMRAYPAVIILDNIVMDEEFDLSFIDGYLIERIEKIDGAQASMLGFRGAEGGVLLITKKGGGAPREIPIYNMVFADMPGYKRPVEFYSPKYETREQHEATASDLRTTLYWKPDIWLNNGEAEFEFYTADSSGSYSIVIEGVTTEGEIIRQVGQINKD